ncbi:phosphoenolpyruvate--protein phosphotransferase, partial [Actinomadura bangladeshensis]|nr:phosphoenolpyruvate--protein phosphotransferase [Actinomadura bangladeshensis]
MRELAGLGVSPGAAAGPVEVMGPPPALPPPRAGTDPAEEERLAVRALEAVGAELEKRAA